MEDVSERFGRLIEQDENYQEALGIVRNNSEGRIWLIGGAVYRTLLFEDCNQAKDFDFVVDEVRDIKDLNVPSYYWVLQNRFGGIKLVNRSREIDLIVLGRIYQIEGRGLEHTIKNYLAGVPFNIHAIAYDVGKQEIIDGGCVKAMEGGVLRVNDLEMAERRAEMLGISVWGLLEKKAMELGFDYEMSNI